MCRACSWVSVAKARGQGCCGWGCMGNSWDQSLHGAHISAFIPGCRETFRCAPVWFDKAGNIWGINFWILCYLGKTSGIQRSYSEFKSAGDDGQWQGEHNKHCACSCPTVTPTALQERLSLYRGERSGLAGCKTCQDAATMSGVARVQVQVGLTPGSHGESCHIGDLTQWDHHQSWR